MASPIVDPPAITYGAEFSFQFPADTFLNPDADPLIYTASGMPAGINFDGETRTFFGASAETGDFLVTIMASDSRTPSLNAASEMTITIDPASLWVAAGALSKVCGASDPELSFTASGWQFDDTAESALTGSLLREAGEKVSEWPYAITASGLSSPNYNMTFHTGTFTITATPAPVLHPPANSVPDVVIISWVAVPGVRYRVQYKARWDDVWLELSPEIRATESTASLPDQPIGATERFYRVVIP